MYQYLSYVILNNKAISLFIQLEKHAKNFKIICNTQAHKLFQTGNMTRSLCVFYIIIYEKKFEEDVFIILFIAIKPSRCLRAEKVHKSSVAQD